MALKGKMTPENMTPDELKKGGELLFKDKPLTPEELKGFTKTMKILGLSDRLSGDVNDDRVWSKLETSSGILVKLDELKEKYPKLEYKIANGGADNAAIIDTNIKVGNGGTLQMKVVEGEVTFYEKPSQPNKPAVKLNTTSVEAETLSTLEEHVKKSTPSAQKSQAVEKNGTSKLPESTTKAQSITEQPPKSGRVKVAPGLVPAIIGMIGLAIEAKDKDKKLPQTPDEIAGMMGPIGYAANEAAKAISGSKPETPKKEVEATLSEADKRVAEELGRKMNSFGIPSPTSDTKEKQHIASKPTQKTTQTGMTH